MTMKLGKFCISLSLIALGAMLYGHADTQRTVARILANQSNVKWEKSPDGAESATLREDPKTGAIELFARYPAGHVFPAHWHTANERLVLIEGRMSIEDSDAQRLIEPGGYAYLPSHEVQRMTCVSETRCSFYVFWDAPLDNHPAK
jgi:glyoxylate utilization-related uncharacterized protein